MKNKILYVTLAVIQPIIFGILSYIVLTKDSLPYLWGQYSQSSIFRYPVEKLIESPAIWIALSIFPVILIVSLWNRRKESKWLKIVLILSFIEIVLVVPLIVTLWFLYMGVHGIGF